VQRELEEELKIEEAQKMQETPDDDFRVSLGFRRCRWSWRRSADCRG
jgi:hypothetical protein